MVKLLIIADDFTGALDTGVQFAASGAKTKVVTNIEYDFQKQISQSEQVLVLDAETRHLAPDDAYQIVYNAAKRARESGIPFLYKKTDSALRGNVGVELKALLDAGGKRVLHFIPAFPKMNRIVKEGVLYIDGIPVQESVFGKDPFEPVTVSYIPDLFQKTLPVTVVKTLENWKSTPGIMVYDAQTDAMLAEIGSFLEQRQEMEIMAGCAGFAAALPSLLGLTNKEQKREFSNSHFLVVCGSVNPITKRQLDYAEKNGFLRVRLTPEQKLSKSYYETEAGKKDLAGWKELCRQRQTCIFDTNDLPGQNDTNSFAQKHNISLEELRVSISSTLGYILKELVLSGIDSTTMITGGDCLRGFTREIACEEIAPVCELAPGTVLSEIEIQGKKLNILSKSGGFGEETLLTDLAEIILKKKGVKTC